ncbi:MAG: conjugal transfer protein TraG, partial [Klebsiella pneumoniae]|nr:conjugal transfer protein TraG [Klebsiella pneumoniae]
NMWPITAVMVNAYVKMVLNQQFDTWSSLGVQTTMNWANMGSIQETYGSYLSVASALYCMVPMLTLFLLTTSIHPMMGALKNVTPDAPANTGHVTPEVWSAGNAGKQSFGDQTHTAATSTGAGMSSGGLLNAAVRSSMPSLSLGNNLQDTVSAAGRNDIGTTRQSTRMTSQGLNEAWSSAFQGQHSQNASITTQGGQKLVEDIATGISNGIGSNVGMSSDAIKGKAMAATLQAGGDIAAQLGLGTGKSAGVAGVMPGKIMAALKGALLGQISSDSKLSDAAKKGMTDNIENMFKSGSAFSSDLSKYASNVTQDGFSSSDTYQKAAQKMDQYSQSISNTETNAFNKTGGQASQLAMSNSLNIDGNMISGETVAKNLADIKQTSAMFKNAVSMMGANEQILSPAAEKLDQFVALGSGGQYANYQEQAQTAPDTSGVSSAGAITGGMDSQRGLTSSNLGQHQEAARVQPSTSIGGISAQTLSGNNGRQYVEDEAGKGASRVLSSGDRDKLNYIRENMPVGSPKETYESAKQAGDAADATTGKAQSLVLGDPKSSDYKASTQQTMQSLQTEEPPKSIDTFRSSGDRTSDAESALAQAALHAANANNQIGTAREQSLAESNAYREKYNQITGSNLSEAGVERIVRQAADGKNNGFSGGLKDVISAEVNGTGTTGRPVTGSADSSLGKELRENNGASEHPMDKASAAFQKTGDAIPGHEVASDLAQRVAGIIPGGNALVPDIGSQRNVPNAMGISNNRAPGSLISNISNNIQLSQAVDSASVNAGINDEKFTRMSDQNQMLTESVQKALANDSRYGPDVAAEYPKFIASLPSNIGVNEGTKMTKDFLDKHRKN